MTGALSDDDSVVDGKLVDAQPLQSTSLLAPKYHPGRQDCHHSLADLAHRAIDGIDEAASEIDHAPNKVRVGAAKIEQDRNAVADPVSEDLGVAKLLDDQDVRLNIHGSNSPDGRGVIAARANRCGPRSRRRRLDTTTFDATDGFDPAGLLTSRLDMTRSFSLSIGSRPVVALIFPSDGTPALGTAIQLRLVLGDTLVGIDGIFVDQPEIHQRF
jgi:hypothetical protein